MNKTARFLRGQLFLAFVVLTPISFSIGRSFFYSRIIKISEVNDFLTDDRRDIYSTFDTEDENDNALPLDPFDLMNRLKKAGAMNDATTPSEAIDEALNAFDQSEY